MSNIVGNLVRVVALLVGIPPALLFVYDTVAVRPHLAQVESILSKADSQDASPPQMVRDLIDASADSPNAYAARLVTSSIYSHSSQGQSHVRNMLWGVLLTMHFSESQMYGLYATLAYNGTDYGLSNFAGREYGRSLANLSPVQAANTVAITRAPSVYLKNRDRLAQQASVLLVKSGHAP